MNSLTSVVPTPQAPALPVSAENNAHHCHCFETMIIVIRYRMVPALRIAEEKMPPIATSVTALEDRKVSSPKKTPA